MNLKQKKRMAKIGLIVGMFILAALPVTAALSDSFTRVLINIDGFFTGQQYKPYAKTIDFIFFTMFFMALYVQVIKYAFKENTRPVKFIAILLGIMSGFLLTAGGYSVQKLIPYIPWLIFLLLWAFFYRLLSAMEWPKSKGWRLFLSFLLAALLLWLLSQWLFPQSNQFGSFFDGMGRIDLPTLSAPSLGITPPSGGIGQGNANVPVVATEQGWFSKIGDLLGEMPWWGWLLPLLLLGLIFGGASLWNRLRRPSTQTPDGETPTSQGGAPSAQEAAKIPLDEVKKEIEDAIKLKEKAWQNIAQLMEKKKKATFTTRDVYHKIFTEWKIDPAYLIDKDKKNEASVKLGEEGATALEIIALESELEKQLLELLLLEQKLLGGGFFGAQGSIEKWDRVLVQQFLETKGRFEEVLSPLVGASLMQEPGNLRFPAALGHGEVDPRMLEINKIPLLADKDIPLEVKYRYTKALMGFVNAFRGLTNQKVTTSVVTDAQNNQISVAKQGTIINLLRLIPQYIVFTRKGSATAAEMKKLANQDNLIKWIEAGKYPLWQNRVGKDAAEIEEIFNQEVELIIGRRNFTKADGSIEERSVILKEDTLRYNLWMQIRYLKYLLELIKFLESERKSFTRIQDLWVQVRQNGDWKEVLPSPNLAFNLHGAKLYGGRVEIDGTQQSFKVCTRLASGITPVKAVCYVNYEHYLATPSKPENLPTFEAKSISDTVSFEIPTAGLGNGTLIGIFARSEKGTYARMDRKFIQAVFNPPANSSPSGTIDDPHKGSAAGSNSAGGMQPPPQGKEPDPIEVWEGEGGLLGRGGQILPMEKETTGPNPQRKSRTVTEIRAVRLSDIIARWKNKKEAIELINRVGDTQVKQRLKDINTYLTKVTDERQKTKAETALNSLYGEKVITELAYKTILAITMHNIAIKNIILQWLNRKDASKMIKEWIGDKGVRQSLNDINTYITTGKNGNKAIDASQSLLDAREISEEDFTNIHAASMKVTNR